MRLHSEEMKPFEKSCSNCYYKFEQPCTKNNHGRCLRKGKFKFWRDYYDLCIGCKRQNTQAEDYSVCCVCKHISITHSKDFYEGEIMDKEFDKTKIYTPLNITKDLIGAKGYFSDTLGSLKEYFNNERLDFVGKIVDFNENTIFIEDNDGFTNSDGWQFFYFVEMPKEKDELEINGVLNFSKSRIFMEDFQSEFLTLCEDFHISFSGSFYELDRDGEKKVRFF